MCSGVIIEISHISLIEQKNVGIRDTEYSSEQLKTPKTSWSIVFRRRLFRRKSRTVPKIPKGGTPCENKQFGSDVTPKHVLLLPQPCHQVEKRAITSRLIRFFCQHSVVFGRWLEKTKNKLKQAKVVGKLKYSKNLAEPLHVKKILQYMAENFFDKNIFQSENQRKKSTNFLSKLYTKVNV